MSELLPLVIGLLLGVAVGASTVLVVVRATRTTAAPAGLAPRGGAVLDIGTGHGVLLAELASKRPDLRLTGVDLSADMVAAASRNLARFGERATAQVGDVADLSLPDGSFDLVISSMSMHHWADVGAAAAELARVLRPGGRLCVYDFRSAPFDTLTGTAAARSLFAREPPRRTEVRPLVLFPRMIRLVMTA